MYNTDFVIDNVSTDILYATGDAIQKMTIPDMLGFK